MPTVYESWARAQTDLAFYDWTQTSAGQAAMAARDAAPVEQVPGARWQDTSPPIFATGGTVPNDGSAVVVENGWARVIDRPKRSRRKPGRKRSEPPPECEG